MRFTRFSLIIVSVFSVCFVISCADSEPQLASVDAAVVFDFTDETAVPAARLSVFVQTQNAVQRSGRITVTNDATSYKWVIENPLEIASADGQWAGSADLQPRYGQTVLKGAYTVSYAVKTGSEVEDSFTVQYPEQLEKTKAAGVPALLGSSAEEHTAVYAENGDLLYYGTRKKDWMSDSDIWLEYTAAATIRRCFELQTSKNSKVICLMVPVHRG